MENETEGKYPPFKDTVSRDCFSQAFLFLIVLFWALNFNESVFLASE